MGAQQHVRIEIEGVVHRPGRVMAWDVERLEVVIVVFDLRTFGNAVANVGEELLDSFQSAGNRMQTTGGLATAWRVTSMDSAASLAARSDCSNAALRALRTSVTRSLATLISAPTCGRSSAGKFPRVFIT
jgi:hypothetical protein